MKNKKAADTFQRLFNEILYYLSRHPRNVFFYLFDLVNDLLRSWLQCFCFSEKIFGSTELSFIHHDGT